MTHLPIKKGGKGDGDDDEKPVEPKGGPEAGEYTHPVPVPDGNDAMDNSRQ